MPHVKMIISFFVGALLGLASFFALQDRTSESTSERPMRDAVEFLVFEMEPAQRDRFIQIDRRFWTETLSRQEGFLSKEVWIDELHPGRVTFVTYWESKALWKAIPAEELAETDRAFKAAIGHPFQLIEEGHKTHHWHRVKNTRLSPAR